MLKRQITYTSWDDEEITEEFCFHLSKAELIQMEVEMPGGMEDHLTMVSQSKDGKLIIQTMKDLILKSYGVRDGNRFRKNADLREEFESSEAFSELFMELATDAESAAKFVIGIMPAKLDKDLDKIIASAEPVDKTNLPGSSPITITRAEALAMPLDVLNDHLQNGSEIIENVA